MRSLTIDEALNNDVIIVYKLNNTDIPFKHGYPLLLIVPGWYGMTRVKRLKRIIVIKNRFRDPFQTSDYIYYSNQDNNQDKYPVTWKNVNSTI